MVTSTSALNYFLQWHARRVKWDRAESIWINHISNCTVGYVRMPKSWHVVSSCFTINYKLVSNNKTLGLWTRSYKLLSMLFYIVGNFLFYFRTMSALREIYAQLLIPKFLIWECQDLGWQSYAFLCIAVRSKLYLPLDFPVEYGLDPLFISLGPLSALWLSLLKQ